MTPKRRPTPADQGRFVGGGFGGSAPPGVRRMRRAVERSLAELRRTDRLGPLEAALVAAYRDAAALAEDEMIAGADRSTFSAERALRLLVDIHVRLCGDATPTADEAESFLAVLRDAPPVDAT